VAQLVIAGFFASQDLSPEWQFLSFFEEISGGTTAGSMPNRPCINADLLVVKISDNQK
jgi:hypothetical protein